MMRVIFAIALCLVALPAAASGGDQVKPLVYGSNLKPLCDADRKSSEYAKCWSFVAAVFEVLENSAPVYDFRACIPPPTNFQTAVDLTTKWLHDHPDEDILAGSSVTAEALESAFPGKPLN